MSGANAPVLPGATVVVSQEAPSAAPKRPVNCHCQKDDDEDKD